MRKYLLIFVLAFQYAICQSGAIDTSFNCTFPAQGGTSIAIQPDGKILVAAQILNNSNPYKVIRLNSDGTVDSTFDDGLGANAPISKLKLQPDGKILIGGEFTSVNGVAFNHIARLNSNGSVDTTFNIGFGATDTVKDIAIQSDGKILIGGVFNAYNNFSSSKIARLNTDGSIDATFNVGSGFDGTVEKVALQPDGKIIASGTYIGIYNTTYIFGIARLNIDGSIDSTFTLYNTILGFDPLLLDMAVQSDGKILLDGDFRENSIYKHKIVRLNSNGVLDSNFTIGKPNSAVNGMSTQADGKILIYGYFTSYNSISKNGIVRLNTDGSLDASFSAAITGNDGVWSVAVQQDKKIVALLYYSYSNNTNNSIVRFGYTVPPTALSQSLCYTSTVANLVATGSALQWYTVATGGTALASTKVLTSGTYYVSQTVNGVESLRTTVNVIIDTVPTTPGTISGTVSQGALVGTATTATYSIAAVSGASSYFWTTPPGVTIVSGQGTTSVNINFQNVSSGAGSIGSLMVQSVNASGCKSLAKSLTLTKALPTAPTSLVMTDGITTTAITNISKYMGTATVLKLTAATVAKATSYEWELPQGVQRTDGTGNNSTVPYIYVNLSGVNSANVFSYYTAASVLTDVIRIGVKAKNGVGVSIKNNATLINPTTSSTAKLLTLTATLPSAVSVVEGQISGLCGENTYSYSFTASALASSYTITAPAGSIVRSTSNTTNATNVLNTTDLSFTITYPTGFMVTATTPTNGKTITITAVNGVGNSLTNKVIILSTSMSVLTTISGGTTYSNCNQTFVASSVAGAITYTWTVPDGASIVSGQGTNTVVVNYGQLTGTQTIKVNTTNVCGTTGTAKILSLTQGTCPNLKPTADASRSINSLTIYPNPVTTVLSIENTQHLVFEKVMVIDLLGQVIFETTADQHQINVESLTSGTYFLIALCGNEQFTAKFIKE